MARIVMHGACGKMGREISKNLLMHSEHELVGFVDVVNVGQDFGEILGISRLGKTVEDNLKEVILKTNPEIVLDFSRASGAFTNILIALENKVRVVSGTTGFSQEQIKKIEDVSNANNLGCIIAPNFSIGALLLMKLAQMAAKYFSHVEIIEYHHNLKVDAPSGTAIKTAELLSSILENQPSAIQEEEKIPGSRGGDYRGIKIHSVRLPGLVAHQEVIFGGRGQSLTLRHDVYSRESYLDGILFALKKVLELDRFVFGLDELLF
ncbi:4-hydroxy-tetrahydrodipicolinate reductase [Carboxydothermus ferrireducens]|uniref:4-hydroxy-tetrahydrodipicolinate reductase n=1 Tax=Carboxydothermus ferrireducens DSM 11255 TaxID=1119529 RepID=A0ABX2RA98_9THEO|nr:4-hydroxy-tetrahydrodipicolinate reductase [Carboxydothermus ferrireducens]NYE57056.1 4-hydroxy-tetrahydrodipicolinate reductase [Carboxydothermus ferrireducens DSM 11255]